MLSLVTKTLKPNGVDLTIGARIGNIGFGGEPDLVKCPFCGKDQKSVGKEWDYAAFHVKLFGCPSCGKTFKAYYRGEELSHTIPKEKQ